MGIGEKWTHNTQSGSPAPQNKKRKRRVALKGPICSDLTSRYSSIPYLEPSRPRPDCLTPPNGATCIEALKHTGDKLSTNIS